MIFLRAIPCPAVDLAKEDIQCAVRTFCSMKITEDVREYAAEQGVKEEEAVKRGLERKAKLQRIRC